MAESRVTHCGKQIMLDGRHLADAATPEAAEVITIILNTAKPGDMTSAEIALVERFFA